MCVCVVAVVVVVVVVVVLGLLLLFVCVYLLLLLLLFFFRLCLIIENKPAVLCKNDQVTFLLFIQPPKSDLPKPLQIPCSFVHWLGHP